ncbi:MAG TPA: tetratricopeptide repeat protein, partial [Blastocatellia bacterium]|nr:tetratricopeptide repeat protein [Blastocatellia bacterium]
MQCKGRYKLIMSGVIFALVFCLTVRPVLNAADPESSESGNPGSLADKLFAYASDLGRALHEHPPEERSTSDYRRALDAYGQVIRLNTDNHFSAESLIRRAELLREMADATGDSAVYQQAIEAYRSVVTEHTHSAFVGEALTGIAQIYKENLQDLDGAAAAYRQLISYFPSSVMAREARAVLARFEAELKHRPVDVVIAPDRFDETGMPTLTNVRNFSGPDYARVVIDLSDQTRYSERLIGNMLSIRLDGAAVSLSLSGRRFIVGDGNLLKRIVVSDGQAAAQRSVEINIEVGSLGSYSTFRLAEPERILIDLHAPRSIARNTVYGKSADARPEAAMPSVAANADTGVAQPRTNLSTADRNSLKSLPEITDPI